MGETILNLQEWLGTQEDDVSRHQRVLLGLKTRVDSLHNKQKQLRSVTKAIRSKVDKLAETQEARITTLVDARIQMLLPQVLEGYLRTHVPHLLSASGSAAQLRTPLERTQVEPRSRESGSVEGDAVETSERSDDEGGERPDGVGNSAARDEDEDEGTGNVSADEPEVRESDTDTTEENDEPEVDTQASGMCLFHLLTIFIAITDPHQSHTTLPRSRYPCPKMTEKLCTLRHGLNPQHPLLLASQDSCHVNNHL